MLCLKELEGPTLIMHNSTAGCYQAIGETDIASDRTARVTCEIKQDLPKFDKLWRKGWCLNRTEAAAPKQFDAVNGDGFNHIYCYTQEIVTATVGTCDCPPIHIQTPRRRDVCSR